MARGMRATGALPGKKDQAAYPLRQRKVRVTQGTDDRVLAVMKHLGMADRAEAYRHVIQRGLQVVESLIGPATQSR